jgi:DNA-binding NtrC family response regulator
VQTILIVEDQALIRMHGADIIEGAGFRVLEASSADEAVDILNTGAAVHLVFSDIDMPGSMDGLELAAFVHVHWPEVRLLLTSGHQKIDNAALLANGLFVPKPWDEIALLGKIRAALEHHA